MTVFLVSKYLDRVKKIPRVAVNSAETYGFTIQVICV